MDEHEIIRRLLTLPREVRQHLVATYRDAATAFRSLMAFAQSQQVIDEMKKQQAFYIRVAKALTESLGV